MGSFLSSALFYKTGVFRGFGFSTALNYPYKGSAVPNKYYGISGTGIISVMLEINKRILLPGLR